MDFIFEYYFDFGLMGDEFDRVLDGFFLTLKLSILSGILSLIWGLVLAVLRQLPGGPLAPVRWATIAYIDAFRGIPLLLVLFLLILVPMVERQIVTLVNSLPEYRDWFMQTALPWIEARTGLELMGWLDPQRLIEWVRSHWQQAGGVEGGISSGEVLWARVAMKPLATLNRPVLTTVDVETKQETVSFKERTDVTAVPAMGLVAETMVALVLAGEALRKFGGDSLPELVRNRDGYLASLR